MLRHRPLLEQHRLSEREEKNFQILELLRQRGPLTRTELSQGTGFNIVTVSNYISEFIKQSLVLERGFDVSTGGRKPVLVELNSKAGFAIGVDVGRLYTPSPQLLLVITDLRGYVVHKQAVVRPRENLDRELHSLNEVIRDFLKTSPVDVKQIQGIGVGLPGVMDERAGTVRDGSPEGIRTNYLAIRDQLESELRLPVMMGNDSTLAGYGELRLGLERPVRNLVYLFSDVGASLIFNGYIYWGSGGSAGELGVYVPSEDDYLKWIKSPQFALPNVWDLGIAEQARRLTEQGEQTAILELAQGDTKAIHLLTVLEAAQRGDVVAREVLEHAALQLGIRIASIINLLNPEVVVIGGGIEQAGSLLFEPVWRAVKRYAYEEPASLVDVLPAQLGENAVALGAACWVIGEVFIQA